VGAGGPRDGAAHRHVQCSDPDLAVERPAPDGRAAEPLAQGAAGARACRGVGGEGGFLRLGSVGGAVGRLVRVYAEAVRHQSHHRGSARQCGGGLGHVRIREQRLVQHRVRAAAARLHAVRLQSRHGAGAPRPERPLSLPFHPAAVPGAAHRHDPPVGQFSPTAAGFAGQGPAAGPPGIGAGARAPSADRREPGVPDPRDGVSDDRHSGYQPHGGARAAAARHGALPRRLGDAARRGRGRGVRCETAGRRDLVAAVTASGKIQPKKKVDVSADITGRITKIAVREGDPVKQGQFLIQIDPTIYEANLQQAAATMASAQAAAVQAKANLDQSERALRRTKELHTQSPNLISTEQLEQAQTAFDVAEANLNAAQHQVDQARAAVQSARDNLRKTTLIAPMTGRVTRLAVEEGEVAVPSTFSKDIGLLLTVSDLSVIQAKVKVDETDVVRVHLGDSVEVSIDAFPDTVFVGRVTKVSDSSVRDATSAATGQNDRAVDYEVEITLDKPPADIRPDLSATARIVTDTRKQALSIPIIALTVRENKPGATEGRAADTAAARK